MWSLDNQKREFLRKRLSEQCELLERFTGLLLKSRWDALFPEFSDEDDKIFFKELWDVGTKIDLTFDRQLNKIYNEEFLTLFMDKLITEYDKDRIKLILDKMKMRIYKLIVETYN